MLLIAFLRITGNSLLDRVTVSKMIDKVGYKRPVHVEATSVLDLLDSTHLMVHRTRKAKKSSKNLPMFPEFDRRSKFPDASVPDYAKTRISACLPANALSQ